MIRPPIEELARVRTKIVATVGPASRDPAVLRALVEAGVDVVRLNFSHGSHDDHTRAIAAVRAIEAEAGRPLAVLQDLSGPKLRLGPIPGEVVECPMGGRFTLARDAREDDPHRLTCTYRDLPRDLAVGDLVLFADGNVAMTVTEKPEGGDAAVLEVTLPGPLRSRQGVNLPGSKLQIPALTAKDLADLEWTARARPDYVAMSFVRSTEDVLALRQELGRRGVTARVMAKIEKPQALDDLEAIIAASDAIMVARGDLGVEMDVAQVPAAQKRVLEACRRARVPAITATQMLNSMEKSSRPTRAEAADVFNAVLDGSDAVMLSGETAIGEYPVAAVATMSRIAAQAEAYLRAQPPTFVPSSRKGWILPVTETMVEAAGRAGHALDAALMIVVTHSGRTALALSKGRHPVPILAITGDLGVARAMNLEWGVTPIHRDGITDSAHGLEFALAWARERDLLRPGDRVVLLRGLVPGNPVQNALVVQEVE